MFCVPLPGVYSLGKYSLQKNDISGIFWNSLSFLRFSLLLQNYIAEVILVGSSLLKIHRKLRTHDAINTMMQSTHEVDMNQTSALIQQQCYLTVNLKMWVSIYYFPHFHDNRKKYLRRNEIKYILMHDMVYTWKSWPSCCHRAFHMLLVDTFSQALKISLNFNSCESLISRSGSPEGKWHAKKLFLLMPAGEQKVP